MFTHIGRRNLVLDELRKLSLIDGFILVLQHFHIIGYMLAVYVVTVNLGTVFLRFAVVARETLGAEIIERKIYIYIPVM